MKPHYLRILHYKHKSSDKVYIVEVISHEGRFVVVTRHGKRKAANLSIVPRMPGHQRLADAIEEAKKKAFVKTREGYKEASASIQIPAYSTSILMPQNSTPEGLTVSQESESRKIEL